MSILERFGKPVTGSVPTIVRSFTRLCHQNGDYKFLWKSKYYEHITRNDKDLNNIRDYILNNPIKWWYDKENPNKAT
jgi:REP element-mobilizing transposase RayT